MRNLSNYPNDIHNYDYDLRSPFYEDPSDGLDELDDEDLQLLIRQAESCVDDEDLSVRGRRACEKSLTALYYEHNRRQSLTDEGDDGDPDVKAEV